MSRFVTVSHESTIRLIDFYGFDAWKEGKIENILMGFYQTISQNLTKLLHRSQARLCGVHGGSVYRALSLLLASKKIQEFEILSSSWVSR